MGVGRSVTRIRLSLYTDYRKCVCVRNTYLCASILTFDLVPHPFYKLCFRWRGSWTWTVITNMWAPLAPLLLGEPQHPHQHLLEVQDTLFYIHNLNITINDSSVITIIILAKGMKILVFITCFPFSLSSKAFHREVSLWHVSEPDHQALLGPASPVSWRGGGPQLGLAGPGSAEEAHLWHHQCPGGYPAHLQEIKEQHTMAVSLDSRTVQYDNIKSVFWPSWLIILIVRASTDII